MEAETSVDLVKVMFQKWKQWSLLCWVLFSSVFVVAAILS